MLPYNIMLLDKQMC